MSRQNKYIAVLEKLLTELKNPKPEEFKASRPANPSEKKKVLQPARLIEESFFSRCFKRITTARYVDRRLGSQSI